MHELSRWIINSIIWRIKRNVSPFRRASSIVFPINSRSSVYIKSRSFPILIRDIGICNNFVKCHKLDPRGNTDKGSWTIFLSTKTLFISWFPCEGQSWNMRLEELNATFSFTVKAPSAMSSLTCFRSFTLRWWYWRNWSKSFKWIRLILSVLVSNDSCSLFDLPFYCLSGKLEECCSSCSTWYY